MRTYDIMYESKPHPLDGDYDEVRYRSLGMLVVTKVGYIMDTDATVSFHIETTEPFWLTKLNLAHKGIKEFDKGLILVDSYDVFPGDVFEVFIPRDSELVSYYDRSYNDGRSDIAFLCWHLKSRKYDKNGSPLIDLTHIPNTCPLCGKPLLFDEATGQQHCSSSFCYAHMYRDLSRYLTIACKLNYNSLLMPLIRQNLLTTPEDLYDPTREETAIREGGGTKLMEDFWSDVANTQGNVKLGDYIQSLPMDKDYIVLEEIPKEKQNLPAYYLCPDNINKDFSKNPLEFLRLIENTMDLFYISEDFELWKDKSASMLEKYISIELFFQLGRLFSMYSDTGKLKPYSDTFRKLCELGVFANS